MADFKIIHDRPNCIACGACAALNDKDWEMDENDGLSNLKGSIKVNDQEHKEIEEKDYQENRDAADACPVNIIHIEDLKNNVRLI